MPGEETKQFLTREAILGINDTSHEDVFVRQWNGYVRITTMTAGDRDRFEYEYLKALEEKRTPNIRGLLVARCAVDAQTGKRLFTDEDAALLAEKNGAALDELYATAQKINIITDKDIEELVKQSGSSPDSDSSSS